MGWIERTHRPNKPWRAVAWDHEQRRKRACKAFADFEAADRWWRLQEKPQLRELWDEIAEAPELTDDDIAALNAEAEG